MLSQKRLFFLQWECCMLNRSILPMIKNFKWVLSLCHWNNLLLMEFLIYPDHSAWVTSLPEESWIIGKWLNYLMRKTFWVLAWRVFLDAFLGQNRIVVILFLGLLPKTLGHDTPRKAFRPLFMNIHYKAPVGLISLPHDACLS